MSLVMSKVDIRARRWRGVSDLEPESSDVNPWYHRWRRLQKTYIGAPSSSHPVTLLEEMFWDPWVGALAWGKEGYLFREQEPMHPLNDIPVGNCTLLLGGLKVFIFLVRKFVACLITILPHCVFLYVKIVTLYTSYGDLWSLFVLTNHLGKSLSWNRLTLYLHVKIIEHVIGCWISRKI